MNNPVENLKKSRDFFLNALTELKNAELENVLTIEVDCEKLAKFNDGCHGTEESSKVFRLLHNNGLNEHPAVYWFDIISDHSAEEIRSHYTIFKDRIENRTIPAVYKNSVASSKVLYVGKGKGNISGRMFLHFGYEEKKMHLQGLQLCHWDFSGILKGLRLKLNIVYFNKDFKEIVPFFERNLAKEINPILGKHK